MRRVPPPPALPPPEFKPLRALVINSGRVVSKMQILDHVWEYDWDGEVAIVESYISYLRRKVDQIQGADGQPVLVRVHSSCATGDIFGSMRCECGEQLHKAMELIEKEGRGVVVYLNQEGRGIGLMEKIRAYKLQEEGLDTVEANLHLGHQADERDYGVGAQILQQLGIQQMRLLSNNPIKRVGLEGYGLEVVETLPLEIQPNEHNAFYMQTKKDRMGHVLPHLK